MKIENLKELEALLKVCNKHGVHTITVDGIVMQLDGAPDKANNAKADETPKTETGYSEDDFLFWSSQTGPQ